MRLEALTEDALGRVRGEIADVAVYPLLLADRLQLDLFAEVITKTHLNEGRFPVE